MRPGRRQCHMCIRAFRLHGHRHAHRGPAHQRVQGHQKLRPHGQQPPPIAHILVIASTEANPFSRHTCRSAFLSPHQPARKIWVAQIGSKSKLPAFRVGTVKTCAPATVPVRTTMWAVPMASRYFPFIILYCASSLLLLLLWPLPHLQTGQFAGRCSLFSSGCAQSYDSEWSVPTSNPSFALPLLS